MSKVNEIFAAPTGELQPVWKYAGQVFYTSSELRKNYILSMNRTSKSKPIINKIIQLTQDSTLLPVYKDKSFWKSILKLTPIELQGVAGATIPESKKVFIFVEQGSNIFSFTSNDSIASVTLHELIHLFSHTRSSSFYSIFSSDLVDFYKNYFCRLLNCNDKNVNDNDIESIVNYLFFTVEKKGLLTLSNNELRIYYDMLDNTFKDSTTLNRNEFIKLITNIVLSMKLIQKFETVGKPQLILKVLAAYKQVVNPLYYSYKDIFNVDAVKERQLVYQELFAPSEVISIQTIVSKPSTKIYKAINQL